MLNGAILVMVNLDTLSLKYLEIFLNPLYMTSQGVERGLSNY